MSIPKWEREICQKRGGSGKNLRNRKERCSECNGTKLSKICANCHKEITGTGNFENPDIRYTCQDIPLGVI